MIRESKNGFAAFYLTILVLTTMAVMSTSLYALFRSRIEISKNVVKSSQAFFIAEAGLEDAIFRIKKNKKYEATYDFNAGLGSVSLSITSDGNLKTIKAVGNALQRVKAVGAVLNTESTTVSFHYGAQVDKGGIVMASNTKVIGNVYSNGSIEGAGSSSQITGDAWVAGSLAGEPDQEWTVKDSDFDFGLKKGEIYYLDTAQKFIPSVSKTLNKASFYLKKVGSPPDQTVRILSDNNGKPGKTVSGSGTLRASKVTGTYSWVDVSFDPAPLLSAGQVYWLMIDVSRDDSNYWVWGKDSSDGYTLGTAKYSSDWSVKTPVWDNVNGDLDFKTIMGGEGPTFLNNVAVGVDARANTIVQSSIGRDAYYQNIDQQTQVAGIKHPGSSDPASKGLPISLAQIQEWEAAAEAGSLIYGNYQPQSGTAIGPMKIEGDLTFPSDSQSNPVIISGSVWVTGKILASNNVKIKLKSDAGVGFAVIADNPQDQENQGKISLGNNTITEDSAGGYLLLISTNKSVNPADPAILISNNVNKDEAQSIVFALQGLIKVENNAKFKEISGFALKLENNAEIVYEEGLINSNFSTGPGSGWQTRDWQEIQ
ncbi:MAG: hypothetical protein Q8N16_04015 [bacterium]|nr:hypothetical protein [bacterium]